MDPPRFDLNNLSPQQILQLAAFGQHQLMQQNARNQAGGSGTIPNPYPMMPQEGTMPLSFDANQGNYGSQSAGGHVHGSWNSEFATPTQSSQPTRVGSSQETAPTPVVDIEETSPPPKVPSPRTDSGTRSKRKGKEAATTEEGKRTKQENFQCIEDRLLLTCWLEISCDPMTNTGQTFEAFWKKVTTLYNSKHGSYPPRSLRSLQCRYDVIKKAVAKFSGYHADVVRRNPSGMTDADKVC